MITVANIVCSLLVFVTSVSPNSSPSASHENEDTVGFLAARNPVYVSNWENHGKNHVRRLKKRHTPFLPGDHWKGMRPDFGTTETDIEVMVNGTAKMKCPITHVSDNRVSKVLQLFAFEMILGV